MYKRFLENLILLRASTLLAFLCLADFVGLAIAADPDKSQTRPILSSHEQHVDLTQIPAWLDQMSPAAKRGYRHLVDSVYLPPDLDEEVASELARLLASRKDDSTDKERVDTALVPVARDGLLQHYGLTVRPDDAESGKPLQYVVNHKSQWVMNCFACHGGSVYGTSMPGSPNNNYQLQSFVEDIRSAKLKLGKPLGHMEIGSMFMPLGTTAGTTNAVMFGVALMHFRDAELNVLPLRPGPPMVHHDMDPPAWWLMHRKTRIYADGFAQKGHRGLMQFMLVRENGPEKFRAWESDFSDVLAFIESLRPPKYPAAIDHELAARGRVAFNENCSRCHGTYGDGSKYPELLIPIDEVGTDRVRLDALSAKHRSAYGKSWFAHYGEQETWEDPQGYMAPPLDGIWASAPYFHNGSVPTLWHVLNPEDRPTIWHRTAVELDEQKVGLAVESLEELPKRLRDMSVKRTYFDTQVAGKSASGHDFPLELTTEERKAVLEYLKTL
jgi:mono/diheme cytochrome c family protein